MITTSGELYFINEQDVRTGEKSNYFKIGIVRDADGRNSIDRLLEHQTGNPRKLCVVEAIAMPAVEYIETNLHYLFARSRVMGEWMQFTPKELESAIAKAHELKDQMEATIREIELAEALKGVISNGVRIAPTHDSEYWYSVIQNLKPVIDYCNDVLAEYDEHILSAINLGIDVSAVAKVQQRAGAKKFDENILLQKYPDLHSKYATGKSEMKGQFRLLSSKDWQQDLNAISSESVDAITDLKSLLSIADHSMEMEFALHEKRLAVLEVRQYGIWNTEIANYKLRALTGENEGIEGICIWKRELKNTIVLDKKKLQIDHPDVYEECVVTGKVTEALIVEPKAAMKEAK